MLLTTIDLSTYHICNVYIFTNVMSANTETKVDEYQVAMICKKSENVGKK